MANTGNTQQQINYGAAANDGQGDPLRTAFIKTDDNFDNVWLAGPVGSNITIGNNTIQSNNTNGNIVIKPNGIGVIQANASVIPNADGVRDLGTANLAWRRAYISELLPENLTVSGDAVIEGNLTVEGDTIQIGNITTDTLTIQLANTAANGAAANGAGITVGANDDIATMLYNSTANRWNVSVGISAVGNISAPYFSGNGSLLTGIVSTYGNANVAAYLPIYTGNISAGNISLNQSVNAGNIFTANGVYGEFGSFTGKNGRGIDAIQAGVTGGTFLGTDVIIQITGNSNAYTQFNFQNINTGTQASTDYVITADNGDDDTCFLNVGLTNSNWDGTQDNSLGNLLGPNDGYLYVQDGDLVMGTKNGNNAYIWKWDTAGTVTATGNLIPSANGVYSLGNSTNYWANLWVANNTIYIGGVPLGMTSGNVLTVNGNAVLSNNSSTAISTTGNITSGNVSTGGIVSATGNITSGNVLTGGIVSATGNITGGNVTTAGVVSASGNVTGNYILGDGSGLTNLPAPAVTQDITSNGAMSIMLYDGVIKYNNYATVEPSSGNITGGNVLTSGLISASGNITANTFVSTAFNVVTAGNLSITSQYGLGVTGTILEQGGTLELIGNGTGLGTTGCVIVGWNSTYSGGLGPVAQMYFNPPGSSGNAVITTGNLAGTSYDWTFDDTGNLSAPGNINAEGIITADGVVIDTVAGITVQFGDVDILGTTGLGGNINAVGANISGNITGNYILGNGSQLTGLPATYGNANVATFLADYGSNTISTTGNVTAGNFLGSGANVDIVAGSYDWTFDNAGNLTLPGNTFAVNYANGTAVSLGGNYGNANVATFLGTFGSNSISTTGNVTAGNLITTANVLANGYARLTGSFDESQASTAGLYLGYAGGTARIMFGTGNTSQTLEIDNDGGTLRFYKPGTTLASLTNSGDFSVTGNISGNTAGFSIGYRDIPQVTFSANATAALADAGKHYYSTTAGNLALTLPDNSSVAFATGTALTIVVNAAGNVLVNQGTGVSLYQAGSATTGNRVVGAYGLATVMKVAANTWVINGTGVY